MTIISIFKIGMMEANLLSNFSMIFFYSCVVSTLNLVQTQILKFSERFIFK